LPLINSSFTATIRTPSGATLADYLSRRFPYHTLGEWLRLIALGRLALDGKPVSGDAVLREGQVLRFAVVDYEEPEVPLDFHVVKTFGDVCFVHKPAGMPVHRTGRIFFQTLANLLRENLGDDAWSPLNRLDRETSGLMAFARGRDALRDFAPASPLTKWTKLYAAVVRGEPPRPEGVFSWPLSERIGDPIRSRMHAHPLAGRPVTGGPAGKAAVTAYRTIAARDGLSLVALSPITGRKHQLRAHLAEAGCPVIGDKVYSLEGRPYLKRIDAELGAEDFDELGARHHLLHAFHLRLESQAGGEAIEAWDWDPGSQFSRYFDPVEVERWSRSPEAAAMLKTIGDLREAQS
jgi:23S rRNA pseudouridine1911/1915/1917 synthase